MFKDSKYCHVLLKATLPRIKRRESRESNTLWRRFGGGRSAASSFQPPTDSPREHDKAKRFTQKRTSAAPPTSFPARSLVLCRDRHKETLVPEVNRKSLITARGFENVLMAISTRAEQEREIPQAVLFVARQTAGVNRGQDIPAGTQQPESVYCCVSAFRISPAVPPRVQTPVPELKPAKRSIAPAHYFIIL